MKKTSTLKTSRDKSRDIQKALASIHQCFIQEPGFNTLLVSTKCQYERSICRDQCQTKTPYLPNWHVNLPKSMAYEPKTPIKIKQHFFPKKIIDQHHFRSIIIKIKIYSHKLNMFANCLQNVHELIGSKCPASIDRL